MPIRRTKKKAIRPDALHIFLGVTVVLWFLGTLKNLLTLQDCNLPSQLDDALYQTRTAEFEKIKRYWTYTQTYRYIPPASRDELKLPVPIDKCGAGPDYAPWFQLHSAERSPWHEDKIIYELYFKNNHNFGGSGTYVELGASNGDQASNTRFFDDCLGWKGLLVEGIPDIYQRTIENRPFAHKMSFAPSCLSGNYLDVNKKSVPFHRVIFSEAYTGSEDARPTIEVPCGPLSPVLEDIFSDDHKENTQLLVPTLDFFSLDVESAEFLVLSTINFQAIRINVIMIEINNAFCKNENCDVRKHVRAKMVLEGYKQYAGILEHSDIYVHPDFDNDLASLTLQGLLKKKRQSEEMMDGREHYK